MSAEMRAAAVRFHRSGLCPIPLKERSKEPSLRELAPYLKRPATKKELASWSWPGVGVVTGPQSGILVLDVDGPEGEAELKKYGHPPTPMVRTPSGGLHLYFKHPNIEARTGIRVAPGLDIKAAGGYVAAPPSVGPSGRAYEWIVSPEEAEIADPPEWLLRLVESARWKEAGPIGEWIPSGQRNQELASLAGTMRRRGAGEEEIQAALEVANRKRCDPPLEDAEVAKIARSIAGYPPEKAATIHLSRSEHGAPVGVLLEEVQPERVKWFWQYRIPFGKLTLVEGDPGTGKSAATTDLASRASAGKPLPDGTPCEACGVVICSAEDGLADTIRPRFDAVGGDPSRVVALSTVPDAEGNERQLSIPEDLHIIESAIARVDAKLVIIDPLMAFLPGEVNSHRDQDVRRALAPLARSAEKTGAAYVVVRHLNKAGGGNVLYRGGGSIGIIGAARSGLLIAKHPEDDGRRVLASIKSNLAVPAPSLAFILTAADNGAVRVEWKGQTPLDAAALLSAPADHEERSTLSEAQDFLREVLEAGPVPAVQVQAEAKDAGISIRTLDRARRAIGVESKREGEPGKRGGGTWRWSLPGIKDAKQKGWQPKPTTDHTDDEKSACSSHKQDVGLTLPSPEPNEDFAGVGNLNGQHHEEIVEALQQLFEKHPETREQTPEQIAEDLYIRTNLDYEPAVEEVEAVLGRAGEGSSWESDPMRHYRRGGRDAPASRDDSSEGEPLDEEGPWYTHRLDCECQDCVKYG